MVHSASLQLSNIRRNLSLVDPRSSRTPRDVSNNKQNQSMPLKNGPGPLKPSKSLKRTTHSTTSIHLCPLPVRPSRRHASTRFPVQRVDAAPVTVTGVAAAKGPIALALELLPEHHADLSLLPLVQRKGRPRVGYRLNGGCVEKGGQQKSLIRS